MTSILCLILDFGVGLLRGPGKRDALGADGGHWGGVSEVKMPHFLFFPPKARRLFKVSPVNNKR